MISLVLEESLTNLLIIMNATSMRIKLTVVRGISMSLNIGSITSCASINCGCLTGCSVRVHLLFVEHFHLLCLISIVTL